MMSVFPTKIATDLAVASRINELFEDQLRWKDHLGRFQRLSLVADYDRAVKAMVPHMTQSMNLQEKMCLELIHTMTRDDVLSIAIESLVQLAEHGRSERDKLAAAVVVNDLYGTKDEVNKSVLTDRLIMNLVGKGQ